MCVRLYGFNGCLFSQSGQDDELLYALNNRHHHSTTARASPALFSTSGPNTVARKQPATVEPAGRELQRAGRLLGGRNVQGTRNLRATRHMLLLQHGALLIQEDDVDRELHVFHPVGPDLVEQHAAAHGKFGALR